jgi:spermidine synthase
MSKVTLSKETTERMSEVLKAQGVFESQAGLVWLQKDYQLTGTAQTVFDGTSLFKITGPITGSAFFEVDFDSHIPNDETTAAIMEARARIDLVRTSSRDDLFKKLNE